MSLSTKDRTNWARNPRPISLLLRLRLILGGSMFSTVGWIFTGMGFCFAWIFVGHSQAALLFSPIDDPRVTQGTVLEVGNSNFSENDREVWKARYAYSVEGVPYEDEAFAYNVPFNRGDAVTIEFDGDNPERSRIPGMRRRAFGYGTLFVLIFPMIGLILVGVGLKRKLRLMRLLQVGEFATGRLSGQEATNVTVNDNTVYKLTFTFRDDRGMERHTTIKAHELDRFTDDEEEPLLFDPGQPNVASLLDEISPRPVFDASGTLEPHSAFGAALSLVPAALVLTVVLLMVTLVPI